MTPLVVAAPDPTLRARLVRGWPLLYHDGPDATLDRPAHVRAGSGIAWLGGRLAVAQDDANFIAIIDPADMRVGSIPLPPASNGMRQFDSTRRTKHLKLDLEACLAVPTTNGELFVAFGSGSSPARECIVALHGADAAPEPIVYHAPALYAALRGCAAFAGSELNIEGATLLPDGALRLFQRGNGAPHGTLLPVDATCDMPWDALWQHLTLPEHAPPAPTNVVQYQLGALSGHRLSFTDALAADNAVLFLAAAEDTPDAIQDGPVVGSVLGIIDTDGARWAQILNSEGRPFACKFEGLCRAPTPGRLWLVMDRDDPLMPTELWEVALEGAWPL